VTRLARGKEQTSAECRGRHRKPTADSVRSVRSVLCRISTLRDGNKETRIKGWT
jgi:hypothetical protein